MGLRSINEYSVVSNTVNRHLIEGGRNTAGDCTDLKEIGEIQVAIGSRFQASTDRCWSSLGPTASCWATGLGFPDKMPGYGGCQESREQPHPTPGKYIDSSKHYIWYSLGICCTILPIFYQGKPVGLPLEITAINPIFWARPNNCLVSRGLNRASSSQLNSHI